MGTTLTGLQIDNSYCGLLKTGDNGAIGATPKTLSDGLGNDASIAVGTTCTVFTGTADFTSATVTGLPDNNTTYDLASAQSGTDVNVNLTGSDATTDTVKLVAGTNVTLTDDGSNNITIDAAGGGAAGLVNDAATDSLKNADSLVTLAACAGGQGAISLGDGATSDAGGVIVIGCGATSLNGATYGGNAVIIGCGATGRAFGGSSVALGSRTCVNSLAIAIGDESKADSYGISIGSDNPNGTGYMVQSSSTLIGSTGRINGDFGVGVGRCSCSNVGCGTAVGARSCINSAGNCGGAFGFYAQSNAAGAYAIGYNVLAATADTVTVCALETCTASTPTAGGIIMTDAGSTARRLNIDASGNLQIDSTPVGGGGAAGLINGVGAYSLKNDDSLVVTAAEANLDGDISLGNGAKTNVGVAPGSQSIGAIAIGVNSTACIDSISIGGNNINTSSYGSLMFGFNNTNNLANGSVALGSNNVVNAFRGLAIGNTACVTACCGIAIGSTACSSALNSVAIGGGSEANADRTVSIGSGAGDNQPATATNAISIGALARAYGPKAIKIGYGESNCSGAGFTGAISIGSGDGWGVEADADYAVAIGYGGNALGKQTSACGISSIALGTSAQALCNNSLAFGTSAIARALCGIAIGNGACSGHPTITDSFSVAIGTDSYAALDSVAVGHCALAPSAGTALGNAAWACGGIAVALGDSSRALGDNAIALGYQACAANLRSITIGCGAIANADRAVALGTNVTAAIADTVTVCALETCTASTPTAGGIIMTDAGSVARRLNIDASGNLQIDSTPVGGGGGAAGLVSGTGPSSLKNADSLVATAATATGDFNIALGNSATSSGSQGSVAIGSFSCACNIRAVALGNGSKSFGNRSVAIGDFACASGDCAIGIGYSNTLGMASGNQSVSIGIQTSASGVSSTVLGSYGSANVTSGIAIGSASARADRSIAIGGTSALFQPTRACVADSIAIGHGVCSLRTNTLTTCQLEACVAGKGIVVTSPDGLTTLGIGIDNSGNIVTYTP